MPVKPLDEYEWLEAQETPECLTWVDAENKRTTDALDALPGTKDIESRLKELAATDVRCPSFYITGRLFRLRKTVDNPQGILEVAEQDKSDTARTWRILLDVDALNKKEGKEYEFLGGSFENLAYGPDASRLLLLFSDGGSDLRELREFDVDKGDFVPDGFRAGPGRLSAAWLDIDTILIQHALGGGKTTQAHWPATTYLWNRGTDLKEAKTVYTVPETDAIAMLGNLGPTDSGRAVLSRMPDYSTTIVLIISRDGSVQEVDMPRDQNLTIPAKTTSTHILASLSKEAKVGDRTVPSGSIIAYDTSLEFSDKDRLSVVWAPEPDEFTPFLMVNGLLTTKSRVHFTMAKQGKEQLLSFEHQGKEWKLVRSLDTPAGCNRGLSSGDTSTDNVITTLSGLLHPTEFTLEEGDSTQSTLFTQASVFDTDAFQAEQLTAESKDGTVIDYTLLSSKSASKDSGTQKVLMTGYGAFGLSIPSSYLSGAFGGISLVPWLEHGGSLALPVIRGGGERGPAWHAAAKQKHRQRSYDDFIAVAERLIKDKVTSAGRIGVFGSSNGGLLAGVMGTQRPDLFGAVVSDVPLADMIRFPHMGMGPAWINEYGDPKDPEMAEVLTAYSPVHNVRDGVKYPPFLVTVSTKDDRVGAGHARKLVAILRDSEKTEAYLFEERDGGHGVSDPFKKAELMSRRMSFFINNLNTA